MTISPKNVWFDENALWVELNDARVIGAPLVWFPRLLTAPEEARKAYTLSAFGIHWDALNEDISVEGLLAGHGDITKTPRQVA